MIVYNHVNVLIIFVNIQESLLLEPMFEIPGSNITGVHITDDYVEGRSGPVYVRNSTGTETSTEDEDLKTSIRI